MTIASLLIPSVYGIALLACMVAWHAARGRDRIAWLGIVLVVGLLLLVRIFQVEEQLRYVLRGQLLEWGRYEGRRAWQILAAFVLLMASSLFGIREVRLWQRFALSRSYRLVRAAQWAIGGFALLYALRLVSLHMIDSLLYFGPIHPNWLLEGGLLLVITAAALRYAGYRRAKALSNREATR